MTINGHARFEKKDARPATLGSYTVPRAVAWVVTGDDGEPDAEILFEVVEGAVRCTQVSITARQPRRSITGTDVYNINLDTLGHDAFERFAVRSVRSEEDATRIRHAYRPRAGTPPDELGLIADTYLQWPAAPVQAVMHRFGLSQRTAT